MSAAPRQAPDTSRDHSNPPDGGSRQASSFAPIFIAGSASDTSFHPLDLLAKWGFMLASFGTLGLTLRTRHELRMAALMLGVVTCFEVTAWSFVFRQFSGDDGLQLSLVITAAALVAAAMTMLERSILISDMDVKGRELALVWLKIGCRLAIILFVAYRITSLPVELVMFRPSIEQRMFQEDVRRNLTSAGIDTINKLREMQRRADAFAKRHQSSDENDPYQIAWRSEEGIASASEQAKSDESQIATDQIAIDKDNYQLGPALANVNRFATLLANLGSDADVERKREITQGYHSALAEVNHLRSEIRRLKKQIQSAGEDEKAQVASKKRSQYDLSKITGKPEADAVNAANPPTVDEYRSTFESFEKFAAKMLRAKSPADLKNLEPFAFTRKYYTDVEKLVLVEDFRSGQPPYAAPLVAASLDPAAINADGDRDRVADRLEARVLSLFNRDSAQLREEGGEEARRMQIIAKEKYWMILGIAVVVPMVALIYKITSGKDLKHYYSQRFQAGSFNPEALFNMVTEEFLDNEKRKRNLTI